MRVLIAYFSLTGNTEMIAKAIFDGLIGLVDEVIVEPISAIYPDSWEEFDVVFLGSACHDADLAKPVKEILDGIPASSGIKLAGFVTHATTLSQGGTRNKELYEHWAGKCKNSFVQFCNEREIEFLGYYNCQGKPSPEIAEFIHREIIKEDDEWSDYIEEVNKHPNQADIEKAKSFAKQVMEPITT